MSTKLSPEDQVTVHLFNQLADVLKKGLIVYGHFKVKSVEVDLNDIEDNNHMVSFYISAEQNYAIDLASEKSFKNVTELTKLLAKGETFVIISKISRASGEFVTNKELTKYVSEECKKLFPKCRFHFKDD